MSRQTDDSMVVQGKTRLRITAELRTLLSSISKDGGGPAFPAGDITAKQAERLAEGLRKGIEARETEEDTRARGRANEPIAVFRDRARPGLSELLPARERHVVQALFGLLNGGAVAVQAVPPIPND